MNWLKRLFIPRECKHEWQRVATGWFFYDANPGKYLAICTKCRARKKMEEVR